MFDARSKTVDRNGAPFENISDIVVGRFKEIIVRIVGVRFKVPKNLMHVDEPQAVVVPRNVVEANRRKMTFLGVRLMTFKRFARQRRPEIDAVERANLANLSSEIYAQFLRVNVYREKRERRHDAP